MKLKPTLQIVMIALLLSLVTGCNRLPAINARSIKYESSYPVGGSTIEITDVEVTDTHVKAGKYHRKSRWWGVNQDITIEGYSRKRDGKDVVP